LLGTERGDFYLPTDLDYGAVLVEQIINIHWFNYVPTRRKGRNFLDIGNWFPLRVQNHEKDEKK